MVFSRESTNRLRDTKARGLLTHDTTRPLKQGSLALSSEISSFTTLQRGEEAVRAGFRTSKEKETFSDGYLHTTPGSPGLETEQERMAALSCWQEQDTGSYVHSHDWQTEEEPDRIAFHCACSCSIPQFTF